MPAKGWQRRFEDLIELPSGRRLATLHDAASFIAAFPKAESDQPEWQDAIEALILVRDVGRTDDVRAHRHHAGIETAATFGNLILRAKTRIGESGSWRAIDDGLHRRLARGVSASECPCLQWVWSR